MHYARPFRDRHNLVWWITADTAALTARLQPASTLTDAQSWALGWFQTHPGWLLMLDSVEDVADVEQLQGQIAGRGRLVVTTRRNLGTGLVGPARVGTGTARSSGRRACGCCSG